MRTHRYISPFIALSALALGQDGMSDDGSFDWSKIAPSKALEYHPCYDGFQCARLTVPLDWLNTSDPRIVILAVIKLPAAVPDSDPTFAGPVLTNPGGPGGSGINLMKSGDARRLQGIIDKPGKRHYEIIGFDPRGVANSWPRANCLPHNDLVRNAFAYEERGIDALDSSLAALPRILAMYEALGRKCQLSNDAGESGAEIMGYMSSPSVCRDMVEIIDRIDELRQGEGATQSREGGDEGRELKKRDSQGNDVPRLQYIGYSYGTALGNYFASLYPERVGRLVLDGVVDIDDYSSGPGWVASTVDADELAAAFYTGCYSAGSPTCSLVRSHDRSGADIQARIEDFLATLDDYPIPAITPGGTLTVISAADVRVATAVSLYNLQRDFTRLSRALDGIMRGNTTEFLRFADGIGMFPPVRDVCKLEDVVSVPIMQLADSETSQAIHCADGDDVSGRDVSWWRDYVRGQLNTSAAFGDFWSRVRLPCSAFRFRTNWSFKGPFTTPRFETDRDGRPVKGKPAAPLLFLSTRLDPVTPLRSARRMAASHPGAGLVVQEGLGHTALGTGDSECTFGIVREYLDTGNVPSQEASCEVACGPWDDCAASSVNAHGRRRRVSRFPLGI